MLKLGIFGKAGNVLDRYRKAGKAWELVPGKAGKPIISKTPEIQSWEMWEFWDRSLTHSSQKVNVVS